MHTQIDQTVDNSQYHYIMRTLIIIVALILAVVIIKRLITTRSRSKKENPADSLEYKDTVRCEHCGTHIPVASALKMDDRFYCNKNHYLEDKKNS